MTVRARIVISVLLALAVGGIVLSFSLVREDKSTPTVRDTAITSFEPPVGAHVLRQGLIAYELDPAYTGILYVDGMEIPSEELEATALTNQLGYVPTKDKVTGVLKPGKHTATAEFWLRSKTRDSSRSFSWSFFVT